MIVYLEGKIHDKLLNSVVVLVEGVGYEVFMTEQNMNSSDIRTGKTAKIFTYHHIRDNSMELYGFLTESEKKMFLSLLLVSGIGPKVALGILNVTSVKVLQQAVVNQDSSILEKVSGIGTKKAQKIIIELKDKIEGVDVAEIMPSVEKDVVDALESFGYSRVQIQKAIREIPSEIEKVEEKIKATLKHLGKK